MKNITWAEHKKLLLQDNRVRDELNALEPEFQLAGQIIKLRINKGLTQTELAKRAHTSQIVISRLENAKANPSLELIKRVFRALDKDVKIAAV